MIWRWFYRDRASVNWLKTMQVKWNLLSIEDHNNLSPMKTCDYPYINIIGEPETCENQA